MFLFSFVFFVAGLFLFFLFLPVCWIFSFVLFFLIPVLCCLFVLVFFFFRAFFFVLFSLFSFRFFFSCLARLRSVAFCFRSSLRPFLRSSIQARNYACGMSWPQAPNRIMLHSRNTYTTIHIYMQKQNQQQRRTNTLLEKNIPLTFYSKGLRKGYVWEMSWRLNKLQHIGPQFLCL